METVKQRVNVATQSTGGHFVENAKQVINLDKVTDSFSVKGKSKLVTANHTTLEMKEDCFISPQQVYNPFAKMYERSQD